MSDVDELKTGGTGGDGQGGNAATGGKGNSDGGGNTDSSKVEFSPEQQVRIQSLVDDAYRRAFSKASGSAASPLELAALRAEIEELKGKAQALSAEGKTDTNEEMKKAIEELNEKHALEMKGVTVKLAGMTDDKKRAMILSAVAKHQVMDAAEVTTLVWNNIEVAEDGSLTVKGEGGAPKVDINNGGQPMSLDTYITGWLNERPHHVRSTPSQGAGSQGSRGNGNGGVKTISREEFNSLTPAKQREVALSTEVKVQD